MRFSPASPQGDCLAGEEGAVGGQRQVEPVDPRQEPNQRLQVAAHQRLAARDRIFSTPRPAKAHATLSISSKVRELLPREERIVAPEDLLRHAVDAAEVAPVRHRDAESRTGRPSVSTSRSTGEG